MLPLAPFRLHQPRTIAEAVALLAELGPSATIVAGGTDLLPNMKNGLLAPSHLVSLARVDELFGIRRDDRHLYVGAMTTLEAVAEHALTLRWAPALAEAALSVGGPQHRRMGTIGGNICLDTRCRYYNQSHFWRSALGFCLKKDGDACHVVKGGKTCVAAASNDTAPALLALDALIDLEGPAGRRTVPARSFYVAEGTDNTVKARDELVVSVRVPMRPGRTSAHEKLRRRAAIDFPLLSLAVACDVDDGCVTSLEVVVSALAAKPRRLALAPSLFEGVAPSAVQRSAVAALAERSCTPLPSIDGDPLWRRRMVPVLVERALSRIGVGPVP